jgi:adenylosuccinate lyase
LLVVQLAADFVVITLLALLQQAVEYFIKERISNSSLANLNEFVHFACTSEDINNLAYGCLVRNARLAVVLPVMDSVVRLLRQASVGYADVAMLSRTHGQPATPTTLGKELANFVHRLEHHRNVYVGLLL